MQQPTSTAHDVRGEEKPSYREVRFRHSAGFAPLLESLGASLLVSTYQAGKLVTIGATQGALHLSLHNFQQAMGLALHPRQLAVGSQGVIWFLQNAAELAPRLDPPGRYDACYLARRSFITGNIHGHEMAWAGDELWVVNTLFSCLCTLDDEYSFVPRWRPPFITELEGADRCHLNGLAMVDGRPAFVTAMAASNEPAGWRPTKAHSGLVLDVASGEPVSQGLSMPHSPRVHGGRLWVLNSGRGALEIVDRPSGKRDTMALMPGYTRGLAFWEHYAFIGLSRIRETAVFGGVPIAEKREELKCGIGVVDLRSGQTVATLAFESGVEEIFDVQVLPGARSVSLTGPYPTEDDAKDVWLVPLPGKEPPRQAIPAGRARVAESSGTGPPMTEPTLRDEQVTALVQAGLSHQQRGEFAQAVELLQRAAAARPQSPELHNYLGNACQDFGRQDLAQQSYERAIQVRPDFAPAHQNLGYLLINFGELDQGLRHLRQAQEIQPANVNRVMLATALPILYQSVEEVRARREALERQVARLAEEDLRIDTSNSLVPTNFFAAYQGYNDRDLHRHLSRLYDAPQPVEKGRPAVRSGRIRVGFLSAHFRDHTIGRLNLGRIAHLDRGRFEVVVISIGHHRDAMAGEFRARADQYVEPSGSLDEMRRQIVDLKLDLLFFADVGMNALTYTLAMSRMAPVQCVTWGHPVTTGYASMDHFVSSDLLETPSGDEHYTERLARLANLGTYYYRPKLQGPPRTRESFGLSADRHLYLCPQTLFKMHPEFDPVLAEILRRDPRGDLVLIEGRQPQWTRLLQARFARTMPEVANRVRFLPPLPNEDFLQLNAAADVLVDTLHFGGGNTSYEGLALGTPIVTLPGEFLRSRITLALYRKMQWTDCVVSSPDEYVELAVRLGTDRDFRQAASEQIRQRNHVLFEDAAEVRELERFLNWAVTVGEGETFGPA